MTKYGQKLYGKMGENLKRIRLERKLLQVDVAVLTDLNSHYISTIERGKARININTLCKLIEGMNISVDELIPAD